MLLTDPLYLVETVSVENVKRVVLIRMLTNLHSNK